MERKSNSFNLSGKIVAQHDVVGVIVFAVLTFEIISQQTRQKLFKKSLILLKTLPLLSMEKARNIIEENF